MKAKMLIIILLLSFFIRLAFAYAEPVKWWDETVYASLGWDLKSNPFHYSFDGNWSDYVPGDWPKAGYRAPLLPYMLAGLFFFSGQNMLLLNMLMPVIGTINVLLVYLLGKKLFSSKIGLYSAAFLALMPLQAFYSGKILTDVLSTTLITLSVFLFVLWLENRSARLGVLTGVSIGLSVLSRYVSVILLPLFLAVLIFKEKNIKFLRNKSFLLLCLSFLLVMLPWFVYGYYEYGNPIGWFWHGQKAAGYWGVFGKWYEILPYFPAMFSITIFLAVFGIAALLKKWKKQNNILLISWLFAFVFFSLFLTPYREERYFMQITPALAIMAAVGVESLSRRLKGKNPERIIFRISIMVLSATLALAFVNSISKTDKIKDGCFLNAMNFLKNADGSTIVFTDNSPIVYFYTNKGTHFQAGSYERMGALISENYRNRTIYYFWERGNSDISRNDSIAFSCPDENSVLKIYEISNITK